MVRYCLKGLAEIESQQMNLERASRLMGKVQAIWEKGLAITPEDIAHFESRVAFVREQLGETLFNQLTAEGRAMTLEQAIEYALEKRDND